MSYYRAGDVIRLSRLACCITQEELAGEVCAVETLSRIENGKYGVKKETYEKLMARMQRTPEKAYAISSGVEVEVLDDQVEIESAIRKCDYERAFYFLKRIEQKMGTSILSRQYVERERAIILFCMKKIGEPEFVDQLEKVIQLTVPDYRKYIEKTYPFTKQEMNTLMSLAIAYKGIDETVFGIQILDMLLRCLEMGYMDQECSLEMKISINCNRAKMYGILKNHEKAIQISKKNLEESKTSDCELYMVSILVEIAWNMIEQVKMSERKEAELTQSRQYLRQAYYLTSAKGNIVERNIIQSYYEEEFKSGICQA